MWFVISVYFMKRVYKYVAKILNRYFVYVPRIIHYIGTANENINLRILEQKLAYVV